MTGKGLANPEDLSEEQQEGMALYVQAEALRVVDAETFDQAATMRRGVKDLIGRIVAHFKPIKERERAAWQGTVDTEKAWLDGPNRALDALNKAMSTYETEQRRQRALAEQRAAEEARVAAEVARRDGVPVPLVVTPAAPVELPKAAGVSFATAYKAVVVDKMALIAAVAEGKVGDAILEAVDRVLTDLARGFGPQTPAKDNPGVQYPMPGHPGVVIVAERRTRG